MDADALCIRVEPEPHARRHPHHGVHPLRYLGACPSGQASWCDAISSVIKVERSNNFHDVADTVLEINGIQRLC